MTTNIREQLHKEIDRLPDEIVQQLADFALFLMAKRQITLSYIDWRSDQWQEFMLEEFFSEDDEVEYTLKDAEEVYRS